jgi:hypothetical protein
MARRRRRNTLGRPTPPPIVTAEIKYRCPGAGIKRFIVVGPTASEAIRKAANFDPHGPGVPLYIPMRCRPIGVELVQRRRGGGLDGAAGPRVAKCPKKLHEDVAAVRRQAHDVSHIRGPGSVAVIYAKDAERAARDGRCKTAKHSLAEARAAIKRAWRA